MLNITFMGFQSGINKDITCPKPTVPKPERTIVEHVDKTRKCSYCKETGHEKSRNGEHSI
jgi:hypothetical protein